MKTSDLVKIDRMRDDGHNFHDIAVKLELNPETIIQDYAEAQRQEYERERNSLVADAAEATEVFSEDDLEDYASKEGLDKSQ